MDQQQDLTQQLRDRDLALRKAVGQRLEQQPLTCPGNLAFTTLRRIKERQAAQERRSRRLAAMAVTGMTVAGVAAMALCYGRPMAAWASTLLSASPSAHAPSWWMWPVCMLFLATVNHLLRQAYAPKETDTP